MKKIIIFMCLLYTSLVNAGAPAPQDQSSLPKTPHNFNKVEKGESLESCKDRFFTFLPKSEEYSKMHDFNFYKLSLSVTIK